MDERGPIFKRLYSMFYTLTNVVYTSESESDRN